MKSTEANMKFPVLGFTPDHEIWGFPDLNTLTSCGPRTLKNDMQSGLELVDSSGRCWVVRSIRRVGRAQPLLRWVVGALLTGAPQSRIEQELEERPSVSLEEIKKRVIASLEATADDYCAEDEREEILVPLMRQVRVARSVARIHEALGLDSFMAY